MNRDLLARVTAAHVHRLVDPYGPGPSTTLPSNDRPSKLNNHTI